MTRREALYADAAKIGSELMHDGASPDAITSALDSMATVIEAQLAQDVTS